MADHEFASLRLIQVPLPQMTHMCFAGAYEYHREAGVFWRESKLARFHTAPTMICGNAERRLTFSNWCDSIMTRDNRQI
jgi:hypothetical protein